MHLLGAVVAAQRRRVENVAHRALGVPAAEQLAHLGCDGSGGAGVRGFRERAGEEGFQREVGGGIRVQDVDVDGAEVVHFGRGLGGDLTSNEVTGVDREGGEELCGVV